jgi:hypothetical protein
MPYDSDLDFAPVIQLLQVPFVLIVNPELVPMRTLPERSVTPRPTLVGRNPRSGKPA